jgi:hypothetical protein
MMKAIIIIVYVLYIVVNLFIFIRDESNPWRLPLSSLGDSNTRETDYDFLDADDGQIT